MRAMSLGIKVKCERIFVTIAYIDHKSYMFIKDHEIFSDKNIIYTDDIYLPTKNG